MTSKLPLLLATTAWAAACAPRAAPAPATVPSRLAAATQLVVVTTPGWDATAGELQHFVRADPDAPWQAEGGTVPVVIGRRGLAWGVDFEGLAAKGEPRKREGDGRSPAGVLTLDAAFGFLPADSMAWLALPYLPLGAGTECVDDTASAQYNRVVERDAVPRVDWRSAERMRQIQQYQLGVVTGYNTPAVKARGSCIFLHVWAGARSTTAGCTALDLDELTDLVAWLDPRAHPVLLQLPAGTYERLQGAWRLPPRGL